MCAALKPPLSIFWADEAPVLATGEAAASRRMRGKDEGFNCGGAERDNMTAVYGSKEWPVDNVLLDYEGEGLLNQLNWPTFRSNA